MYIYSNLLRIFQTTVAVSSPPVHQLTHVGNRLSRFMLLSQAFVALYLPRFLVLQFSGQLAPQTPSYTHYCSRSISWEGFQPYTCLPWNSGHISTHLTRTFTFSPQCTSDSTCNISHTPLLNPRTPGGVLEYANPLFVLSPQCNHSCIQPCFVLALRPPC